MVNKEFEDEENFSKKDVRGKFIIQIAGKPKNIVDEALDKVYKKIDEDYEILEGEIVEPELDEETTLFSGMIELTIKFDTFDDIFGFIIEYIPVSIELEKPLKLILDIQEMNGILNDFSQHILQLNNKIRELEGQIYFLTKEKK